MYLYDQAHSLVRAIRESEEYKSIVRQRDKIEADPQAKQMFTNYRTQQIELQKLQMLGQAVPNDKMQALRQLHDVVMLNPVIKEFLEAEQRFGIIMADIQKILMEGLDLD